MIMIRVLFLVLLFHSDVLKTEEEIPRPPRPPLPDIDTCTPRGGTCVNGTADCGGFVDTWALCRNSQLCCKPAPSTIHPEPVYPNVETCGMITRINKTTINPLLRIVGGDPSEEGEWPWMVSLDDLGGHFCGGTLISERWIVTAAHCLESKSVQNVNITLGEHHKAVMTGNEVVAKIDTWIIHPEYGGTNAGIPNDIALIRLQNPVNITGHYVRTACLPVNQDSHVITDCYISGWGYTNDPNVDRRHLQHLKVSLMPTSSCNESWSGIVLDSHICAGNGDTGTCRGDSGGPLVCYIDNHFVLVGVTSWGVGSCQQKGYPDIYTHVTSYLDWIHKMINKYDDIEYSIGDVIARFIRKITDSIMNFIQKIVDALIGDHS